METVLWILGVMAVLFVLLMIAGFILLAIKYRGLQQGSTPPEIHLKPAKDHSWKNAEKHKLATEFVCNNGFSPIGIFSVEEMPGVFLHGFVKTKSFEIAVIYEHPAIDHWIDFVAYYADEGTISASNAPLGGELDHKPGHEKHYMPGNTTEEVHKKFVLETFKSERMRKQPIEASEAAFVELFERGYREEQTWRNAKGGPSAEEIRRIAASSNMIVDDRMIEESRRVEERKAYAGLCKTLTTQLQSKLDSSVDWNQERFVFVHDNLSPTLLREIFHRTNDYGNAGSNIQDLEPPRATFKKWNATLPPTDCFEKIAELDEPLPVDVYKMPKETKSNAV